MEKGVNIKHIDTRFIGMKSYKSRILDSFLAFSRVFAIISTKLKGF
jgi:hypothetical protein